uniref:cytochrome-c oxidase, cbb3-type subunit III n=1 Tax=Pararhizobium sp. IMCC3301 TaxID=3067904 RepID=UPI0027428A56|nr:cytochrome-c oxidase, cbb3-type subunit III [Pararhizobium sp. IMCC3301]
MAEHNEIDEVTGVETTGHDWDGIKELNNPLPRWWLWTFYATIVFSIGYTIAYPAWPGISGATKGVLGWSSRADVSADIARVEASRAVLGDKVQSMDLADIQADPELLQFAIAGGASAFKVNCSQCHGAGAAGGGGYPNLLDDDWIWGGELEQIYLTLQHGIRSETHEETRLSDMPAFGSDDLLERSDIVDVAWYVRQLSGQDSDTEAALRGESVYADNCAACHGDDGKGNRDLGAPDLSDAIWLYGGEQKQIVAQISEPQQGVMPGWADRLNETTTKQLAIFVHSLGGGE